MPLAEQVGIVEGLVLVVEKAKVREVLRLW
jgi:hypothetical protein